MLKKIVLSSLLTSCVCNAAQAEVEYPVLSEAEIAQIEKIKPSCRKIGSEGSELSSGDFVLIPVSGQALLYQVSFKGTTSAGFKQPAIKLFGKEELVLPTENVSWGIDPDGTKVFKGQTNIGMRINFHAKLKPGNINWTVNISWGENSTYNNPGSTTTIVDIPGTLPPIEFKIRKLDLKNPLAPIIIVHSDICNVKIEVSTDLNSWTTVTSHMLGIQSEESCVVLRLQPPPEGFGEKCYFRARK